MKSKIWIGAAAAAAVLATGGCSGVLSSTSDDDGGRRPIAESEAPKSGDAAKARKQLKALAIAPKGPSSGYDRDKYGARWKDVDRNGCDTRNDILARDLVDEKKRGKCVVISGTLNDPYTGKTIKFTKSDAQAVQIDHVYPLSLSWKMGAKGWQEDKRERFANDPDNLLAVDGPTNQAKGDSGPEAWRPRKAYQCAYAIRYVGVAAEYKLPITRADQAALGQMLDTCK
ncbi:HNH endonuclease family protein [Bailinhaonella thermotolerans]|uniref:HNH endonuclease family protein n=1 Tax=Bailinhaonella thermotolerans TaxID=1070861 RepID=UPI001F5B9421|nr:HNH endonuclease family protein [Bailinhaonella thermotolerans]